MVNKGGAWKSHLPRKVTNLTVEKAVVLEKIVRRGGKGLTGLINLPKRLIGQRFVLILVPEDEIDQVNKSIDKRSLKI